MTLAGLAAGPRWVTRAVVPALLLAAWLGTTTYPPHVHVATSASIYNQAHVLSTLAAVGWDGPLSAPAPLSPLLLAPGAQPCAIEVATVVPGGIHADPRGPPSA